MIRRFLVAVVLAAALPAAALTQSPTTTPQHEHGGSGSQPAAQSHDRQTMQMHQQMMADMAAMEQKLDSLVTRMNAAQGQAKVDEIAAVITAMVDQQKKMHQHMASMMGRGGMMGSMMGAARGEQGMTMGTSGAMADDTFDPVCRVKIANNTAPTATYQGKTYQFCSVADKELFLKDPAKYTGR